MRLSPDVTCDVLQCMDYFVLTTLAFANSAFLHVVRSRIGSLPRRRSYRLVVDAYYSRSHYFDLIPVDGGDDRMRIRLWDQSLGDALEVSVHKKWGIGIVLELGPYGIWAMFPFFK